MLTYRNNNRNIIICSHVIFLETTLSHAKGLMGKTAKNIEDTAHIFVFKKPKFDIIHMWFMRTSIDVIALDKKKNIIGLKKNMKPWTSYFALPKQTAYFIELSCGVLEQHHFKIGNRLDF